MYPTEHTLQHAAFGTGIAPSVHSTTASDADARPMAAPLGPARWLREVSGWASDLFLTGLNRLAIAHGHQPALPDLNQRLKRLSGWELVIQPLPHTAKQYAQALSRRQFPLVLGTTSATVTNHQLLCVAPVLAYQPYADFLHQLGVAMEQSATHELRQWALLRVFRHIAHFGVMREANEPRAFGSWLLAGYLGKQPLKQAWLVPFSIESLLHTPTPGEAPRAEPTLFVLNQPNEFSDLVPVLQAYLP